jgi:diguanylate cyclase (GGDEF)-like protein/PAS domain S-box-containing protein
VDIINKNGYKAFVKFNDLEIGDECDIEIHKFKILNKKEGRYKSYLILPIMNNGYLVMFSEFENEFESEFTKEYLEIQKVINFAVTTIKQNMLMQILKEAIEKSYQWVLITDESGNIIYVNDVVLEMTGYKKEDILGNTPFIFIADKNSKELYDKLISHMRTRKMFEDLFVGEGKNGEFYLKVKVIPVEVDDDVYFVALGIDMTKEKKLHESLFVDEMTGFLNRKGFLLRAKDYLVDDENYALFLMDIRNFKALNQIKGNIYGNLILKQFAYFLKTFFYEEDLIARIGGDEFAVLMKYDDMGNIAKVLQKLIKKIEKIENTSLNIGVALYPKDAKDIYSLIEKAYIALEFAKKEGENSFEFYNEQIQAEVETFLRAKVLINEALKKDKFEYFFQPYYDIKRDKIVGAEALIRIMDEDEVITPNYFIDYAEKSGIIKNIEDRMFQKLPRYLEILKVPVSFNISAVSFKDEEHIEKLNNTLNKIPLTIELTERTVAKNMEYAKILFNKLKEKNFQIAIDDFGTGYSSLSYVKELNFDVLKIDINFIKNIENSYKDLAIVKTIITLAKSLNLKTIAEGVETIGQLNLLQNIGCDIAQGFLIAKPMPVFEAAEFIKTFKGIR